MRRLRNVTYSNAIKVLWVVLLFHLTVKNCMLIELEVN